jgi:hypothetical protein
LTKVKSRLTYANVIATVALFLALGGVATAAFTLPKKSVGPKQLKANAVKTGKIKDGAVTTGKLADAAVTSAKLAGGVAFKNVVYREVVDPNKGAGNYTPDTPPTCQSGEVAIDGGVLGTIVATGDFPNTDVDVQAIVSGPATADDAPLTPGATPAAWHVSAKVINGPRTLHYYVLCAQK